MKQNKSKKVKNNSGKSYRNNYTSSSKEKFLKPNLFDLKFNKRKTQLLGQRAVTSEKNLASQIRNKSDLKRKHKLKFQYNLRHKRNRYFDKRIGEHDTHLSEEDKYLQRFAIEKKHTHLNRQVSYSQDKTYSHLDNILSLNKTKFDSIEMDSDIETHSGDDQTSGHFGGGLLSKSRKSIKDRTKEIVELSKLRKAERLSENYEMTNMMDSVHDEWKHVRSSYLTPITEETSKLNSYDKLVRELSFLSAKRHSAANPVSAIISSNYAEQTTILPTNLTFNNSEQITHVYNSNHLPSNSTHDYNSNLPENLTYLFSSIDTQTYSVYCTHLTELLSQALDGGETPQIKTNFTNLMNLIIDSFLLMDPPISHPIDYINAIVKSIFSFTNEKTGKQSELVFRLLHGELVNITKQMISASKDRLNSETLFYRAALILHIIISISHSESNLYNAAIHLCSIVLTKYTFPSVKSIQIFLFLVYSVIHNTGTSIIYMPEILNALSNILGYYIDTIGDTKLSTEPILLNSKTLDPNIDPSDLSVYFDKLFKIAENSDSFKEVSLIIILMILKQVSSYYMELPSYPEMFFSLHRQLNGLSNISQNPSISCYIKDIINQLDSFSHKSKLNLLKIKPISINFLTPMVNDSMKKSAKYLNTKVKSKYRKEFKGALRDLRKDSSFLLKEKMKITLKKDRERKIKLKSLNEMLINDKLEHKKV